MRASVLPSAIVMLCSFGCGTTKPLIDAHSTADAAVVDARHTIDAGPSDARLIDGHPLQWYTTCGDVICHGALDAGLTNDAGVACPAAGTSCATLGQGCGTSNPGVDCGATLLCDDHDPKQDGDGCPI